MKSNAVRALAFAALALALVVVVYPLLQAAEAPAVGAVAPDFKLSSQEGNPVSLRDYRGKWVVLYFYPKDFTTGCTIEAHNFERDMDQYEKLNTVILGVSVDSVDSHKDFCAKEGISFKLLADTTQAVVNQYGSVQTVNGNTLAARNTFLIDPTGKIAKVYMKVDPTSHSTNLLADISALNKK